MMKGALADGAVCACSGALANRKIESKSGAAYARALIRRMGSFPMDFSGLGLAAGSHFT